MKTIAVFPGSFAPWTNGHFDTLCTALNFCDEVVIGVSRNPSKPQRWTFEELKSFIEANIKGHMERYENRYAVFPPPIPVQQQALKRLADSKKSGEKLIKIVDFISLTVDDALRCKCSLIIRGMRNSTDYADEEALASVNQKLASQRAKALPTVLIPQTDSSLKDVSSTTFRNLMDYRQYIQALEFVTWNEFNLIVGEYLKPQWQDIFSLGSEEDYRDWTERHLHSKSYPLVYIAYLLNMLDLYASQIEDEQIFRIMKWTVMSYQSVQKVNALTILNDTITSRKFMNKFYQMMDGHELQGNCFEEELFHDICRSIYADNQNYPTYRQQRRQMMSDADYLKRITNYRLQGEKFFRTALFRERYAQNLRANLASELDSLKIII